MNSRAWYMYWLGIVSSFVVALASGAAKAADKGMSFIGASKASAGDIVFAANALVAANSDVQFAMLPFEFNANNPFGNATALVQSALPRVNGRLRISVYLKWFRHDAQGNAEQSAFWNAWNACNPDRDQRRIKDRFMNRVNQANAWVVSTRAWASQMGLQDRLGITLVPVLEDTCPTSKKQAYANVLAAISNAQRSAGMNITRFRRSCLSNNVFRVSGASLEMHGRWSQVQQHLQRGDTWSNDGLHYDGTRNDDGSTLSIDQFISSQRAARQRGVHVIYWDGSYNGSPRGRDNWPQRTVNPFTGGTQAIERQTLTRVVTAQ